VTATIRVLLATDGSIPAGLAVEWLAHLPFPRDREAMVVSVLPPAPRAHGTPDLDPGLMAMDVRRARQLADETASRLLTGRRSVGRVVRGDAQDQIIAAARDWRADVVVVGARGLGRIKGFFLTSVSLGVVRHAPCPVLVCKGRPRDVRSVTVALDGSSHARRALDALARLSLASTTRVALVGVVEPGQDPWTGHDRREQLQAELNRADRRIAPRVASVETIVTAGDPATSIVREAALRDTDLLVVGARGAGATTRLLLGSVSESVLRRAPCPVLVVRALPPGTTP
jgi:nucleotide-binding universal stress UspA family protein